MPRNGAGSYSLPINAWNPAINGVSATPADYQVLINDVASALQASVASDGQTPMSGNLQMGGYRLTGAGAPSGAGMSLRWEQLIQGADIPSATTITIPLEGQYFSITGTTAITAIAATIAGRLVYLKFAAGIVLTHSAALIMPSGVSVTTQADDIVVFMAESAGVWRCVSYPRFSAANHPSTTAPTITWPYMPWADTGNLLLKRRNAANSVWVVEGGLFGNAVNQNVLSINGGQLAGMRNKIINGNFGINQRQVSGTVTLAAGIYGHDRWKAGAGGCTYTFAIVQNVTTITITAGTLMQVVEGNNIFYGDHMLSWQGTALGRIDVGAYGTSGTVHATLTGGANAPLEFGVGTLSKVQLEPGLIATPFEQRAYPIALALCQRYYRRFIDPPVVGVVLAGVGPAGLGMALSPTMRAKPTVTVVSPIAIIDGNGGSGSWTGVSINQSQPDGFKVGPVTSGTFTVAGAVLIVNSVGTGILTLDAEI